MANRFSPFDEYNKDLNDYNQRLLESNLQEQFGTRSLEFGARTLEHVAFERTVSNSWINFARSNVAQPLIGCQERVKRKRRSPKVTWKKPEGMPKRPLSAYNIFFRQEREKLLNTKQQGNKIMTGIGFAGLARQIASKWKTLDADAKSIYQSQAMEEKKRYKKEVELWKQSKVDSKIEEEKQENNEKKRNKSEESIHSESSSKKVAKCETTLPDKTPSRSDASTNDSATIDCAISKLRASIEGSDFEEDDNDSSISCEDVYSISPISPAKRAQSDSLLELRSDVYKIRSCEQPDEDHQMSERRNKRMTSSLLELAESLDEDSFSFIADLNHPDLVDGKQT